MPQDGGDLSDVQGGEPPAERIEVPQRVDRGRAERIARADRVGDANSRGRYIDTEPVGDPRCSAAASRDDDRRGTEPEQVAAEAVTGIPG